MVLKVNCNVTHIFDDAVFIQLVSRELVSDTLLISHVLVSDDLSIFVNFHGLDWLKAILRSILIHVNPIESE